MTTAQENNDTGTVPTETKTKTRSKAKAQTQAETIAAEESKTAGSSTATTDETKAAEVNGSDDEALASDASKTENEGLNSSDGASANIGDTDVNTPTTEGEALASLNNSNAPKLAETTENTTLNGEDSTSQDALTAFQLRVKNRGKRAICHVSKATIPEGETVVITYQSVGQKDLARGNFEQINALSFGGKRYIVEG